MNMKKILIGSACLLLLVLGGLYVRQLIPETIEHRVPGQRYVVSLGDSVAAGAGLSGDRRQSFGCDQASHAFPILLSQQLHQPYQQFACSGATVANGPNTLQTQYKSAQTYLAGSDVVVYAGANDSGWRELLTSCAQQDCVTPTNDAAITARLQTLHTNLTLLLQQIQQAKPHRLVVNTYYSLLAAGDTCAAGYGITPEKLAFINQKEAQLNAIITAAATDAHAVLVAVDFSGHTLCSTDPWVQGVTDPAPLHPTATGQQQIATQDATVLAR
jgi:lysophospholipase L1-like esterase